MHSMHQSGVVLMNISKHMIIVVIAVVVIAAGLASALVFLKPDPEKLTINAIDKQLKLDNYNTDYNLSYNTKTGGLNLDANGLIHIIKSGDVTKVSLSLETFGEKIRVDQYQTKDGIIQCLISLINTTCQKVSQDTLPLKTPEEQSAALKQLIEDKELKIDYITTKTIAGRTCDSVKTVYTPKDSSQSGDLKMDMCLDRESGLPLEMIMEIAIGGTGSQSGSVKINMILNSVSFGAQKIVVPQYTEASETDLSSFQ